MTTALTAALPFTDNYAELILRGEIAEVNRRHPAWHAYLSDARRCWAVHVHHGDGTGCGVTKHADSPHLLDAILEAHERTHPGSWT